MAKEQHILNLYKQIGETPLECLIRFKSAHPEYNDVKMTYAGRLDPMAEGVLVVLAGTISEIKKKEILEFDKEYEFEILWGFETDTYDVLGLVTSVGVEPTKHFDRKLPRYIESMLKKKTQEYPPYSSRAVGGKSLFMWAREGKINEVDIPTRHIRIFSIEHLETRRVLQKEIFENIKEKVNKVEGDFRQSEILKKWEESITSDEYALISTCKATVSSGTYIRSLAYHLGKEMGSGALAYSIKRTRVGEYRIQGH